ncbi:hypothetical protein C8A05DRAFT_34869 [Staphylotrichum tortipilum]|uniref:BHLH domain-containing protein n=1 Tax=Staphylotrichum tortipilum TaxID=2831512 RepID=A0AAN6MIE1_9PEZI|nr:hypothetical protein C8A05DRAFT_34869 [Staphylotrichum longicolle]
MMDATQFAPEMHLPYAFGFPLSQHYDIDDLPAPSGNPLLDAADQQLMTQFCLQATANCRAPVVEELGGYSTVDWLPPEVVGHNVSFGNPGEDGLSLSSMYPFMNAHGRMHQQQQSPPQHHHPPQQQQQQQQQQQHPHSRGGPSWMTTPTSRRYQQPPQQQQQQQQQQLPLSDPHQDPDDIAAAIALAGNRPAHSPTPYGQLQHVPFGQPPRTAMPGPHPILAPQYQAVGPSQPLANGFAPNGSRHNSLSGGMVFGPVAGGGHFDRVPRGPEVQFGSDPGFNRANFVPTSERETTEVLSGEQMATLECLAPISGSAATTRASSPTAWAPPPPSSASSGRRNTLMTTVRPTATSHLPPTPDDDVDPQTFAPNNRRRASELSDDDHNQRDPYATYEGAAALAARRASAASSASRMRRRPPRTGPAGAASSTPASTSSSTVTPTARNRRRAGGPPPSSSAGTRGSADGTPTTAAARRRASRGGQSQAPRRTLSAQQRRDHHVASEQKRRDLIKRGYHHVQSIVPGAQPSETNRISKATVLQLTADWIETLVLGNRQLEEMFLAGIGGGGMGGGPGAVVAVS